MDDEAVFKALADSSRRRLLDRLFESDGLTLSELCRDQAISRQAVTKHLGILEQAGLVIVLWRGREKFHFLNPVPVQGIAERWIHKFQARQLAAVTALKRALEEEDP